MDFLNPPNRTVLLGVRQDAAKQSGKAGKLLGAAIESASFLDLGVSARKKTTHCGSFLKGLKIPGENISVTHSPESTVLPVPHRGVLAEEMPWFLKEEVAPRTPPRRELLPVLSFFLYILRGNGDVDQMLVYVPDATLEDPNPDVVFEVEQSFLSGGGNARHVSTILSGRRLLAVTRHSGIGITSHSRIWSITTKAMEGSQLVYAEDLDLRQTIAMRGGFFALGSIFLPVFERRACVVKYSVQGVEEGRYLDFINDPFGGYSYSIGGCIGVIDDEKFVFVCGTYGDWRIHKVNALTMASSGFYDFWGVERERIHLIHGTEIPTLQIERQLVRDAIFAKRAEVEVLEEKIAEELLKEEPDLVLIGQWEGEIEELEIDIEGLEGEEAGIDAEIAALHDERNGLIQDIPIRLNAVWGLDGNLYCPVQNRVLHKINPKTMDLISTCSVSQGNRSGLVVWGGDGLIYFYLNDSRVSGDDVYLYCIDPETMTELAGLHINNQRTVSNSMVWGEDGFLYVGQDGEKLLRIRYEAGLGIVISGTKEGYSSLSVDASLPRGFTSGPI